jgi:hypothetical protein
VKNMSARQNGLRQTVGSAVGLSRGGASAVAWYYRDRRSVVIKLNDHVRRTYISGMMDVAVRLVHAPLEPCWHSLKILQCACQSSASASYPNSTPLQACCLKCCKCASALALDVVKYSLKQ